jgi:cellulose synthase (UDP-forming)
MNRAFLSAGNGSRSPKHVRADVFRAEIPLGQIALAITVLSIAAFVAEGVIRVAESYRAADWAEVAEVLTGRSLAGFYLFGALVYQLLRLGYLRRFAAQQPAPAVELERVYDEEQPPRIAILVPSYKEELRVVRETLLAAALQQSPNRRIVLLIDDPPAPRDPEDAAKLSAMRELPRRLAALFAEPAGTCRRALADFARRREEGAIQPVEEVGRLGALLHRAAGWLDALAARSPIEDHNDEVFVERILRAPAREHRARAAELLNRPDPAEIDFAREYRRLAALFSFEITTFERKRYLNLSHEPNKAMNLNGYLAVMGKEFREIRSPEGCLLRPAEKGEGTLREPGADFVIVLDADSLILGDYSLRLVHLMRQPGNERIAVAQTPYTSVAGAPTAIERLAGATTDAQLMSHQGSMLYSAGSWVGASALVRRAALDDIVFEEEERGHRVSTYIRDRTLNEDTDTTIDLIRKGWTVYNYPDRLAFSATPPDFGSLLIQRRRWATGGLIILSNVLRYLLAKPSFGRLWEAMIRAQYILSAPLGSAAVIVLLVYPFESSAVWSYWPWAAFGAYLFTFGRDLMHNGNRLPDLLRAMALNAMLLPINLAGAFNSVQQLFTGRKIPFQRTPKVQGRTAATPGQMIAQLSLPLVATFQLAWSIGVGGWVQSVYFALYAAGLFYSLHAFIGWGAALEDLLRPLGLLPAPAAERVPARPGSPKPEAPAIEPALAPVQWVRRRASANESMRSRLPLALLCVALLSGDDAWAASRTNTARSASAREVAITFDDLPVVSVVDLDAAAKREITRKLLGAIAANKVPAVGFVNEYGLYGFRPINVGEPDASAVELLGMWLDAGLELANHTFGHADLHQTSVTSYKDDIMRGEIVTARLMQGKGMPLRYFRHPYLHTGRDLATKREVERFLAERGMQIAPVTLDNEDWMFAAAYSRAAEKGDQAMTRRIASEYVRFTERALRYSEGLSRALFGRNIKHVLLLHANALNADHFGQLAAMLKRRGYSFVPLEDALRDDAYASADTYTGGESLNWLARWAVTRGLKNEEDVLDDFPDVPELVSQAVAAK